MNKSEQAIKNIMESTMKTELQTKVGVRLLNNYTNTIIGSEMKIYKLDNGKYEMYPKIWFYGDSTKTITQHNLFADLTINDLKDIINLAIKSNNARNIVWTLQYSSGDQEIIDFTTIS